jgi:hypothetical protein
MKKMKPNLNKLLTIRYFLDARKMLKNEPPYANTLAYIYTKRINITTEYIIENYLNDMRDMGNKKIEYLRIW